MTVPSDGRSRQATAPHWDVLLAAALGALGFFLPFSSSGTAISLGALIALAVVRPSVLRDARPWTNPAMAVGLLLLAYIALHTLWSTGATRAALSTINRYHELLFAPLLLALMQQERHRMAFFRGLLWGTVGLALTYWAALVIPDLDHWVLVRRITAGFAMVVSAFLLWMQTLGRPRPHGARALAIFLAGTAALIVGGRTGQIVLILLAGIVAWVHSPGHRRLAAAAMAALCAAAVALAAATMSGRLQETIAASSVSGPTGPASSTAIRIELARLALDLSKKYVWTGAGFANYPIVHEQAARERYGSNSATESYLQAEWIRAGNAHNEYATQLVGGGVVALGLFIAWLGLALRQGLRSAPPGGVMLAGTVVAFAVGSLFNSMLLDFGAGHLYMGLLAWLLAMTGPSGRSSGDPSSIGATAAGPLSIGRDDPRVLIVATRQIGDVLLTTPLIEAVRARWPRARIDVLGFEGTLGMLAGNAEVDARIETRHRLGARGWLALVRRLWRRYDLALVTDGGDRAHLIAWLASARRSGTIPPQGGSNWWKQLLLDHALTTQGDLGETHVIAEKIDLLQPPLADAQAPVRVIPPSAAPLPSDILAQLTQGAVVVHAPSMWSYKQWPTAHFQTLVRELLARGRQVVLTGSASARDRECLAPLVSLGSAPQLLDVSGRLDFQQLVTLLRAAALYIGPDTSITHLAAASGVRVISIFGPTNPLRWAPWPANAAGCQRFERSTPVQRAGNVTLLQSQMPCVPCGRAGCDDHRNSRSDCLVDIDPQRVLDEVLAALSEQDRKDGKHDA